MSDKVKNKEAFDIGAEEIFQTFCSVVKKMNDSLSDEEVERAVYNIIINRILKKGNLFD